MRQTIKPFGKMSLLMKNLYAADFLCLNRKRMGSFEYFRMQRDLMLF